MKERAACEQGQKPAGNDPRFTVWSAGGALRGTVYTKPPRYRMNHGESLGLSILGTTDWRILHVACRLLMFQSLSDMDMDCKSSSHRGLKYS